MFELLSDSQRVELDQKIGSAINAVVTSQATEALFDPQIVASPHRFILFDAGLAYVMSGEEQISKVMPRSAIAYIDNITADQAKPISHVYEWAENNGISTATTREKTFDLTFEAVENSFYWIRRIEQDQGSADLDKIIKHPTIAAASSLINPVDKVSRGLLEVRVKAGLYTELPTRRQDFIKLFHMAPFLFAEAGKKLENNIDDQRDPNQRGRCPARTIDPNTGASWLENLLRLTGRFYDLSKSR